MVIIIHFEFVYLFIDDYRWDDRQESVIATVWIVNIFNLHHERCQDMKDQQLLEPALREYFKGLLLGGLTAQEALGVYEESIMGDRLGKIALAREKVSPPPPPPTKATCAAH